MDLLRLMEIVTFLLSICMMATGVFPCYDMYKTGDTRHVPWYMFIVGAFGTIHMLHYSLILSIPSMIMLNILGVTSQFTYLFVYLALIKAKTKPMFYVSIGVAYVAVMYGYLYTSFQEQVEFNDRLGAVSGLPMVASQILPLLEVINNVRLKNTHGSPLVMAATGTLTASTWAFYGILLGDRNIYLPNIPIAVVSIAKVLVFVVYGDRKHLKLS